MIEQLLTAFREIAASSAGTEIEAQAKADLGTLEGIVETHARQVEQEAVGWLRARLHHPQAAPAAQ